MTTEEFITKFKKFSEDCFEDACYQPTIGSDSSINTEVFIDEEGFIWLRINRSWKRVKTSVNVNNVVEFRYSDTNQYGYEKEFFIICTDDTGFSVIDGAFYYCVDSEPTYHTDDEGCKVLYHNAVEYFEQFPAE